jgi:hypothetical protein
MQHGFLVCTLGRLGTHTTPWQFAHFRRSGARLGVRAGVECLTVSKKSYAENNHSGHKLRVDHDILFYAYMDSVVMMFVVFIKQS